MGPSDGFNSEGRHGRATATFVIVSNTFRNTFLLISADYILLYHPRDFHGSREDLNDGGRTRGRQKGCMPQTGTKVTEFPKTMTSQAAKCGRGNRSEREEVETGETERRKRRRSRKESLKPGDDSNGEETGKGRKGAENTERANDELSARRRTKEEELENTLPENEKREGPEDIKKRQGPSDGKPYMEREEIENTERTNDELSARRRTEEEELENTLPENKRGEEPENVRKYQRPSDGKLHMGRGGEDPMKQDDEFSRNERKEKPKRAEDPQRFNSGSPCMGEAGRKRSRGEPVRTREVGSQNDTENSQRPSDGRAETRERRETMWKIGTEVRSRDDMKEPQRPSDGRAETRERREDMRKIGIEARSRDNMEEPQRPSDGKVGTGGSKEESKADFGGDRAVGRGKENSQRTDRLHEMRENSRKGEGKKKRWQENQPMVRTGLETDPERSDDKEERNEAVRERSRNVKKPSDGSSNTRGDEKKGDGRQRSEHHTTRSNGRHEELVSSETREDGHSERTWSGMTLNYHHGEATEERKSYEKMNSKRSAKTKSEETINNLEAGGQASAIRSARAGTGRPDSFRDKEQAYERRRWQRHCPSDMIKTLGGMKTGHEKITPGRTKGWKTRGGEGRNCGGERKENLTVKMTRPGRPSDGTRKTSGNQKRTGTGGRKAKRKAMGQRNRGDFMGRTRERCGAA